ncbi:hypothetical protein CRUP_028236, partial [Coryphaenoides rupestris]
MFMNRYDVKQQALFHVLTAYSIYNTGSSSRVSLSFMRFQEHHERILKKMMPKLKQHLDSHEVFTSLYTMKWFFQCFLDRTPFTLTLRIWDIYILEGERVLTAMSYTVLKLHKKHLMRLSMEELVEFLQSRPCKEEEFPKKPLGALPPEPGLAATVTAAANEGVATHMANGQTHSPLREPSPAPTAVATPESRPPSRARRDSLDRPMRLNKSGRREGRHRGSGGSELDSASTSAQRRSGGTPVPPTTATTPERGATPVPKSPTTPTPVTQLLQMVREGSAGGGARA